MSPLVVTVSSAIATIGAVAALRRIQPTPIRIVFRDATSEHLWSELIYKAPSVLLVPDIDAESRREMMKDITRHYLLSGEHVFLCVRASALSVPRDEANVWIIETEAGLSLYVTSGCRRFALVTVFIAQELHARAIYARLPAAEAEQSLLPEYTRWLLGLSGDGPYALHWQLQRKDYGRAPAVVFLWHNRRH
jgi:hypothetical protein